MNVRCEYCGNQAPEKLVNCPCCGAKLPMTNASPQRQNRKFKKSIYLYLILVFSLFLALQLRGNPKPEPEAVKPEPPYSYEQLLQLTPSEVFEDCALGRVLEQIFIKPLSEISWQDVKKIRYLRPTASNRVYYSFFNSWDFDSEDDFTYTIQIAQTSSDGPSAKEDLIGCFIGVRELDIYGYPRVYGKHLISMPELRSLTTLVADNCEELQNLTQLETLKLCSSNGGSLSGLEKLKKLKKLTLENTDYQDLSLLTKLPALTHLTLGKNKYAWDLETLSRLKNLSVLSIKDNTAKSLQKLSALSNLSALQISCPNIKDLRFISSFSHIKTLKLENMPLVSDLSYLSGCPVEEISIDASALSNLDFLTRLPRLESLTIKQCPSPSFLSKLPRLRKLVLDGSPIRDSFSFRELPLLEELTLEHVTEGGMNEKAYQSMETLANLRYLKMEDCTIGFQMEGVFSQPKLETLVLSGGSMTFRPEDISSLGRLKRLVLKGVRDATPFLETLPEMPQLTCLSVPDTGLTSLSFLSRMPALLQLDLSNNPIRDISPLNSLANLEWVNLTGTSVTDRDSVNRLSSRSIVIR